MQVRAVLASTSSYKAGPPGVRKLKKDSRFDRETVRGKKKKDKRNGKPQPSHFDMLCPYG